jgi:hypothetical protein
VRRPELTRPIEEPRSLERGGRSRRRLVLAPTRGFVRCSTRRPATATRRGRRGAASRRCACSWAKRSLSRSGRPDFSRACPCPRRPIPADRSGSCCWVGSHVPAPC